MTTTKYTETAEGKKYLSENPDVQRLIERIAAGSMARRHLAQNLFAAGFLGGWTSCRERVAHAAEAVSEQIKNIETNEC